MDTSGEEKKTTNQERMTDMVVAGKRRRGRPRARWLDNTREDMKTYELTADVTKTDSTGAHKDVEMGSKGEKENQHDVYIYPSMLHFSTTLSDMR